MSVLLMPPVVPDPARAQRHLSRACADVGAALDAAATPAEAFAIWLHCRALVNDLRTLTLRAELRYNELDARATYCGLGPVGCKELEP